MCFENSTTAANENATASFLVHENVVELETRRIFHYINVPIGAAISILNAFLLYCFFKFNFLVRKANAYILSLCIGDVLTGLDALVLNIYMIYVDSNSDYARYSCIAIASCHYFVHAASMSSMTMATIERYIHIVHPFTHANYSESRLHGLVVVGWWGVILLCAILVVIPNSWQPGVPCNISNITPPSAYLPLVLITTWLQLLINVILMTKIVILTNKHRKQVADIQMATRNRVIEGNQAVNVDASSGNGLSPAFEKVNKRRTNMVMVLVAVTLACWLPTGFGAVLRGTLSREFLLTPTWSVIGEFIMLIMLLNSLINPFLYQRFNPDIKKAYRAICPWKNTVSP